MFWVVVEDDHHINTQVKDLLEKSGIEHVYLNICTRKWGNAQKNMGLTYIRDKGLKGIVYFADDDNMWHPPLFDEIRKTKRISIFPVGNLGPYGVEKPIIKEGKIIGWSTYWLSRKFPVDQAGYAFNTELLHKVKDPLWSHDKFAGESEFIVKMIDSPDKMEILCNNCRDCYVWHNRPLLPERLLSFSIKIYKKILAMILKWVPKNLFKLI